MKKNGKLRGLGAGSASGRGSVLIVLVAAVAWIGKSLEFANVIFDFLENIHKSIGIQVSIQRGPLIEWSVIVLFALACVLLCWAVSRGIGHTNRKLQDWRFGRSSTFASDQEKARRENPGFSIEFPNQFILSGLSVQDLQDATHVPAAKIEYMLRRSQKIPNSKTLRAFCTALLLPQDYFQRPITFGPQDYGAILTDQRISRYLKAASQYEAAAIALLAPAYRADFETSREILHCFEQVVLMRQSDPERMPHDLVSNSRNRHD